LKGVPHYLKSKTRRSEAAETRNNKQDQAKTLLGLANRSQLGASMGYFILEGFLFVLGILALIVGKVPVTRRRMAKGSAARLVGLILIAPLPLYLLACKRSNVAPLGSDKPSLDPLISATEGFIKLVALAGAFASVLAATVLAIITFEKPRRD
jgi:hypothetical protein